MDSTDLNLNQIPLGQNSLPNFLAFCFIWHKTTWIESMFNPVNCVFSAIRAISANL